MSQNRWISDLHWRRQGQQTRSEKTQTALLDAAETLILEKGTEATSIADIASEANCSVGTVYHHFKDKKALYFALFHRMTQAYSDLLREGADPARWEGASVRDLIRGYVEFTLRTTRDAAAAKAAVSLVVADYPELRKHFSELQGASRRTLLDLIMTRESEIAHDDPSRAAAFFIDQLGAMLAARADPNQRFSAVSQTDDGAFAEQILLLAEGFLKLSPEQ